MTKNIALVALAIGLVVQIARNKRLERRIEILEESFMTVPYTPKREVSNG